MLGPGFQIFGNLSVAKFSKNLKSFSVGPGFQIFGNLSVAKFSKNLKSFSVGDSSSYFHLMVPLARIGEQKRRFL